MNSDYIPYEIGKKKKLPKAEVNNYISYNLSENGQGSMDLPSYSFQPGTTRDTQEGFCPPAGTHWLN